MKPLRNRLQEARKCLGIPWEVLERDYVLSWLLAGVSRVDAQVLVYSLEEIVAEKLRAILQHVEMVKERGWSRSRARDYYDLWCVLGAYQDQLHLSDFSSFLHAKCPIRNVSLNGPDDFFEKTMLGYVKETWEKWLGPLVPDLPDFSIVIPDLRPRIALLVP